MTGRRAPGGPLVLRNGSRRGDPAVDPQPHPLITRAASALPLRIGVCCPNAIVVVRGQRRQGPQDAIHHAIRDADYQLIAIFRVREKRSDELHHVGRGVPLGEGKHEIRDVAVRDVGYRALEDAEAAGAVRHRHGANLGRRRRRRRGRFPPHGPFLFSRGTRVGCRICEAVRVGTETLRQRAGRRKPPAESLLRCALPRGLSGRGIPELDDAGRPPRQRWPRRRQ